MVCRNNIWKKKEITNRNYTNLCWLTNKLLLFIPKEFSTIILIMEKKIKKKFWIPSVLLQVYVWFKYYFHRIIKISNFMSITIPFLDKHLLWLEHVLLMTLNFLVILIWLQKHLFAKISSLQKQSIKSYLFFLWIG